jgi:hypothetical protein
MKSIQTFLAVFLAVMALPLFAQRDYAFKVLVNKGQNEVKVGDTWQPLRTGSILRSNDELKLASNAYVGLIHATGKPLELKEAKTYKVKELESRIGTGASVLNKYTDFILSSNTEKKNRLSATGAVHRGANSIKVFLPKSENAFVYGDVVILDWDRKEEEAPYMVKLKSIFGDDLYTTEVTNETVTINLTEPKFASEDNIIVEVYPASQPNKRPDPPFIIKKLSPADKERIKNQLSEISAEVSNDNAISKLVLAGFYEQNKLLIDAITAYQQAIKLSPDVEQFKEDYKSFLVRHGISNERK